MQLKIGNRYINTDQITHIEKRDWFVIVHFAAQISDRNEDDEIEGVQPDFETFDYEECRALVWWLDKTATDVMAAYQAANPDATKAQDAPQLKEDGKARVKWTDEEDHEDAPWLTAGMIGTVIEIIPGTRVLEMAFEGHREQVALLIDQVEPVN